MNEVYVVCTYSPGPIGLPARYIFGLRWSHAALVYKLEEEDEWRIIEAQVTGVRERSLHELLREAKEYQVYRLKQPLDPCRVDEIIAFGWGNVGKPYSFIGLLKLTWRLIHDTLYLAVSPRSHICSGFVVACFKYVGVHIVPMARDILVTPDDISNSPFVEEVDLWPS